MFATSNKYCNFVKCNMYSYTQITFCRNPLVQSSGSFLTLQNLYMFYCNLTFEFQNYCRIQYFLQELHYDELSHLICITSPKGSVCLIACHAFPSHSSVKLMFFSFSSKTPETRVQ
jgi:hypothetical protein